MFLQAAAFSSVHCSKGASHVRAPVEESGAQKRENHAVCRHGLRRSC